MKVLHVVYSDYRGGAAIGANRLHRGMVNRGVNSEMLVLDKVTSDASVHELLKKLDGRQHVAAHRFDASLKKVYGVPDLPIRTFNIGGVLTSSVINSLNPDIVQLHWIGNNMLRLDDMRNIKAPLVWKMADMWAFSGGEHYSNADEPQRHRLGYDQVPPFRDEANDVDRMIWELKRIHYADLNLTMVSPSRFLAAEAHQSALLREYDAHVIPNPLPRRYFRSAAEEQARVVELRSEFGLPQDKMLVTFSAFLGGEVRKGYRHVEEMLAKHLRNHLSPDEVECMIIGGDLDYQAEHYGYTVHFRKHMPNNQRYSNLLFASDVLLFPSDMDNSAMVIQEFLAARRPAVVFAVGGNVDMVHHKKSGYLAPPYDVEELARGLKWYHSEADKEAVRQYCGERAIALHDPLMTVESYLKLYEQVLRNTRRDLPTRSGRLFDREVDNSRATRPQRKIAIVDPSCKSVSDSSHNTKYALAFHAFFGASGFKPYILANEKCRIKDDVIDVRAMFDYTAYDKLRAQQDKRGASTAEDEAAKLGHPHYSRRMYRLMSEFFRTEKFSRRDAVFFPMTDRIMVDAVLRYLAAEDSVDGPTFHFYLMFEKAAFLVGEYPIEEMLRALKASKYVGKRIFFYTETAAMSAKLGSMVQAPIAVLRPPALIEPEVVEPSRPAYEVLRTNLTHVFDIMGRDEEPEEEEPAPTEAQQETAGPVSAGADAAPTFADDEKPAEPVPAVPAAPAEDVQAAETVRTPIPEKKPGELWVVAPGRGRRDKGWGRLGNIASVVDLFDAGRTIKIVAQRPRAMDNLDSERDAFEKMRNCILLDEIITNAELAVVMNNADVFLLPYDKNVYGIRGSAFVWEAVSNRKPLLVSANTALTEAIRHGNGLACTDDLSFLTGIGKIVENYEEYKHKAEVAFDAYLSEAVNSSLSRAVLREDYTLTNTVLVFSSKPLAQALPVPNIRALDKILRIHVRQKEPFQKGLMTYPLPNQNYLVSFEALCEPASGNVSFAPEIIEALRGGYVSRVLVDKALPGRSALLDKIASYGFASFKVEAL